MKVGDEVAVEITRTVPKGKRFVTVATVVYPVVVAVETAFVLLEFRTIPSPYGGPHRVWAPRPPQDYPGAPKIDHLTVKFR